MRLFLKLFLLATAVGAAGAAAGMAGAVAAYLWVAPELPSIESLRNIEFQVPLRVYSRDGRLMAEFGEKRRTPVTFQQVPTAMIQAITAAEDDRFFEHPGIDYQGLMRAAISVMVTGEKRQGGSTITMQVARNFFLTREKTYLRKIREIFLALRIERELTKQEIMELYLNKILLGHRAWGVGAAAEVYYGKTLPELTLAEIATIAGLPKAPSTDNPISSPERARERRSYVLRRMLELGHIDQAAYREANDAPIETKLHGATVALDAPYVAEMVRAKIVERYGAETAYSSGIKVTTTLDSSLQRAAMAALRRGLDEYDQRHGYRGPLAQVALPATADEDSWRTLLEDFGTSGDLQPALVLETPGDTARLFVNSAGVVEISATAVEWARQYVSDDVLGESVPQRPAEVLKAGDIVYLRKNPTAGWLLAQIPQPQSAIVAVDPLDGAVVALSGGYDYFNSKFNRAVQARRQPGSSFKPFVFSAALETGFTPATLVNDAPVVFQDAALEDTWRPENYSQRFYGPTRLREALVRSRNLVSIRVLREIGVGPAVEYLQRFGFDRDALPRDLSLALGSISLSPLELASAYTVFANGGFRVKPYFIERIETTEGQILFEAEPVIACRDCPEQEEDPELAARVAPTYLTPAVEPDAEPDPCMREPGMLPLYSIAPRVIDPENAWLIADMMRDVVQRGTGRRASELGRADLSGKTGTTNDHRDAWFSGFTSGLVATVWVGFDQERSLGRSEVGGTAALPAWMYFMSEALEGTGQIIHEPPNGLIRVRISPESGLLARADDPAAIFEVFRVGQVPEPEAPEPVDLFGPVEDDETEAEPLF